MDGKYAYEDAHSTCPWDWQVRCGCTRSRPSPAGVRVGTISRTRKWWEFKTVQPLWKAVWRFPAKLNISYSPILQSPRWY